jgi:hypothetical protein
MSKRVSLLFGLLLLVQSVRGDVLVLVHGYASDAGTWERSGVNSELQAYGWPRAVIPGPHMPDPLQQAANRSFTVNLPAEAPLLVQANFLRASLDGIRQRNNPYRVDELITIASPHLGTVRAAQGLSVVDSKPFFCPGPGIHFLKRLVGGSSYDYLRYSRGVLVDLLPAESGNVLTWMNQQPHPDIIYVSVVRKSPFALGDDVVPAYSQDMNNVPALQGRANVLFTDAGHGLNPSDGILLAGLLGESHQD